MQTTTTPCPVGTARRVIRQSLDPDNAAYETLADELEAMSDEELGSMSRVLVAYIYAVSSDRGEVKHRFRCVSVTLWDIADHSNDYGLMLDRLESIQF